MTTRVQGRCPMGCGETLFLGVGGYVTCSKLACPRPDAATDVLEGVFKRLVDLLTKESRIQGKRPGEEFVMPRYAAEDGGSGTEPAHPDADEDTGSPEVSPAVRWAATVGGVLLGVAIVVAITVAAALGMFS